MRPMLVFALLSCGTSPEPEPSLHQSVVISVQECRNDGECAAKLAAADELLGNCPWYEAIGCSAAVAAAGAACVVTEGEACLEALELVSDIGCCDCLPKGKVRDLCKEI